MDSIHPKHLSIDSFSYELPVERIAQYPLPKRDESKLLVYEKGKILIDTYKNIAPYLPANSLLVFNNTKVIEARLLFSTPTKASIEIFCLEPHEQYPDVTTAMLQTKQVKWKCLIGGVKKWKKNLLEKKVNWAGAEFTLFAKLIEKREDYFIVEFSWLQDFAFAEILQAAGLTPLPPYLNRAAEKNDAMRYQTVYAQHDGSVAAPTAGLHFTPYIFNQLSNKNINTAFVTLHVGAGTFKPVKAPVMEQHLMHAEWIDIPISLIQAAINQLDENIVAVGTTSLRTLESLYWMGLMIHKNPSITLQELIVHQWQPYENSAFLSAKEALTILIDWLKHNNAERLITKTQIIIAPGYSFKIANGLITNFHQPKSTLLLLVAALLGDDWRRIYEYALENKFRFLSYGDGSLLWCSENTKK